MAQYCLRRYLDRHSLRDGPLKTADAIAMKLGINKTAMIRVRAGIRAVWLSITHKMRSLPSLSMSAIGESYESFVVSC
jgi:hypothetical protein